LARTSPKATNEFELLQKYQISQCDRNHHWQSDIPIEAQLKEKSMGQIAKDHKKRFAKMVS